MKYLFIQCAFSFDIRSSFLVYKIASGDNKDNVLGRSGDMQMLVDVERYLEQVRAGYQYKGTLKITGVTFDYVLAFAIPISELEEMDLTEKSDAEIDCLFNIVVENGGARIVLTNEERKFFLDMTLMYAIDFHNNPQTRANNEGLSAMTGIGLVNSPSVSITTGVTDFNSYLFPPELCKMLSDPKFGCALTSR